MGGLLTGTYAGMKTIPARKHLINTLLRGYACLPRGAKMDSPDDGTQHRARQLKAAIEHLEARRWRLAEVQSRVLLAVDPTDVEALLILGLSIAASGEAARAAPILERVRRARPDHDDPCRDLETMQPRVPRALVARQYRTCLRQAPEDGRLRRDFASFLLDNGEPEAALSALRDAPESAVTYNLRGMALAEIGKFREAARCFDGAARLDPNAPSGWANLAMMLKIEGRFDDSLAAYDRAVARAEIDPQIRVNRAVALLHAGRWEEAWRDYEWRFNRPGYAFASAAPLLPVLEATTRLNGTRILVSHEEGLGDSLQFARYLPMLARLGAEVIASVPAPLIRLLRGMQDITVIQAGGGPLPAHDYQCPFFSLPRAFGTTTRNVPGNPYIPSDPSLAAAWAPRLPAAGLSAGLVWAGQARPWLQGFTSVDRRRSVDLAAFAPLASVRDVRFVSLQAGTEAAQGQDPPPGMELTDPMDLVRDFADTAAIIANLDVVISVDTSVAHLAGAMGKPVFLLDRYDNCWRWLHGRTDSPWYPSMTIFRQPRPGDWSSVMHRAASALTSLMVPRSGPHALTRPDALASAA
jgi:Tetratricopeptide repeat/Glycosyltransferase family 9 (heptosyltransferase)